MLYDHNNTAVPVVIVAGMGRVSRVIGKDNRLLWHVPEDLRRFKTLTLGHPVIMGRKTFESILAILGKPLPGRHTIVVTSDQTHHYEGVTTVHSLEEAFAVALSEHPVEIHIGGGASLYTEALPYVDRLHLTLFESEPEGDTFFPPFQNDFRVTHASEPHEHNGLMYQFVDLARSA